MPVFSAIWVSGCRFGGPAHEQTQPPLDAAYPLDMGDDSVALDDTYVDEASSTEVQVDEVSLEALSDETSDAGEETADAAPEATSDGATCTPPTPATCDPVQNTGCNSTSRCDVSSSFDTGECVDLGAQGVGDLCTTSGSFAGFQGTDTCSPKLTCVNSKCVTLCYCDSDCPSSLCCNMPVGSAGFMSCGGC